MEKNDDVPRIQYVSHLPDLIRPEEYADSNKKRVRIRIRVTREGLEILGDSMYPQQLEKLLKKAGAKKLEGVLCG